MKHLVQIIGLDDKKLAVNEMRHVGVHKKGISIMLPKSQFRCIKIKNLSATAANIIKQEMLVRGGEVATAYGAIDHSVRNTDILILGTEQQIKDLVKKLKSQYFGLKEIGSNIKEAVKNYDNRPKCIKIGRKNLNFNKRTYIMGILNVTPDSFSDEGRFIDADAAVAHAKKMIKEGADIIDIGGESTRPGAKAVDMKTELSRVIPVIRRLRKETKALISIDTTKSRVADLAVKAGAHIINDISGLGFDKKMVKVAVKYKAPIVLMHIKGKPGTMQKRPAYDDLISDIISHLQKRIELAIKGGIPKEKIIIDPGIGFGKTAEHNLQILNRLKEFKSLGCPILIGTSRKSVIGKVLNLPADKRMEGTAATVAASILGGANIIRVHDVGEMKRVAKMTDAIIKYSGE